MSAAENRGVPMGALRVLSAAVLAGVLAACSPAEDKGLPAPVPKGIALTVTGADGGKTVDVAVGSTFAVALVGVPTAGYLWAPTTTPAFLSAAGTAGGPTSKAQLEPGFAGGNHWEVFMMTATGPGEGSLVFEQRRPWETDEPPSDTFTVVIRAK